MSVVDSIAARQFAVDVVQRLREAGHEALWAGGCVRDQLLGHVPKDYDVATDAPPDRVREVFGRRRTLPIGAAFGVITVLGPRGAGQIEVATFRRDAAYSDGRHPDSVAFSNAREDAQRRDFTINGLFFDPLENRVIDYVGGQEDLARQVIRAIGDPQLRFGEDKLRMLRGVRFAATFQFALDPATLAAIQQQADDLVIVSAERIAAEMRRLLSHRTRADAVRLLDEANLLEIVLPESAALEPSAGEAWRRTLTMLDALELPDFCAALALLLRETHVADVANIVCDRWRLANDERHAVVKLLRDEAIIRNAQQTPWPRLQRVLIDDGVERLLAYCEAVARVADGSSAAIDYCRGKLAMPAEQLNPAPLITGDDLKRSGLKPGPAFRQVLEAVRDAQLEGRIHTQDEALQLGRALLPPGRAS